MLAAGLRLVPGSTSAGKSVAVLLFNSAAVHIAPILAEANLPLDWDE